jgi:hypothetical protein
MTRRHLAPSIFAILAIACSPGTDGQMSTSQNVATFDASPARVIEALTGAVP